MARRRTRNPYRAPTLSAGGALPSNDADARVRKPVRQWHTWTEFVDAAAANPKPGWRDYAAAPEWAGGVTLEDAIRLARTGYTADLPEIDRYVGAIQAKVRAPKEPDWEYDVAGAEVDIGRAVAGEPEDMIADAPHRETRQGRAVRLVVPVSSCYFADVERVRTRGIAVMALVDMLQKAKHTLEIWAVDARHKSMSVEVSRRAQTILLKPANAPLDLGRVMFALMHPGMPRRLCLATMEARLSCEGGFCPAPYEAKLTDLPDDRGRGQTIIIPPDGAYGEGSGNWGAGIDGAVEWVQHQLDVVTGETADKPKTTRNFANT